VGAPWAPCAQQFRLHLRKAEALPFYSLAHGLKSRSSAIGAPTGVNPLAHMIAVAGSSDNRSGILRIARGPRRSKSASPTLRFRLADKPEPPASSRDKNFGGRFSALAGIIGEGWF